MNRHLYTGLSAELIVGVYNYFEEINFSWNSAASDVQATAFLIVCYSAMILASELAKIKKPLHVVYYY